MADRYEEIRERFRREREAVLARPIQGADVMHLLLVLVLIGPCAAILISQKLPAGMTGDQRTMFALLLGGVVAWFLALVLEWVSRRDSHARLVADLERISRREQDEFKWAAEQEGERHGRV